MRLALWLLACQGLMGAFDTLYYHEWRARLPALGREARAELGLHAARALIYSAIFGTLPWVAWRGWWTLALAALLAAEIVITLADFVVEDRVRRALGGVFHGERVTHALMGIVYGAMLAHLVPVMLDWRRAPTALAWEKALIPRELGWALVLMAVGVGLSGLRDLFAAVGLPHSGWPWRVAERATAAEASS